MKRCIIIIIVFWAAMLFGCAKNNSFYETAYSFPELDVATESENVENSVGKTDPPVTATDIPSAEELIIPSEKTTFAPNTASGQTDNSSAAIPSQSNTSGKNNSTSSSTAAPSNTNGTPNASTPATSTPAPPARECINRPDLAVKLLAAINEYRISLGSGTLMWVDQNAAYAYNQAWYNAVNDVPVKAIHTVDQIGVWGGIFEANNIVTTVVNAWKASPGHNKNMLDPRYDRAGVAVIEIKRNGYTVEFICIVDFDNMNWTHPDRGVQTDL